MINLKINSLFKNRSGIFRNLLHFLLLYKLFSGLVIGLIVSLILELLKQNTLLNWVLSIVSITLAIFLLYGVLRSIRAAIYCVELPAITAVVFSIILRQYWTAFVVVAVLVSRKPIENLATLRVRRYQTGLTKHLPVSAQVLRKRKILSMKVSDILINDKIVLQAGEVVPLDAVILEGHGNFDESSLGGESKLQAKGVGDQIISGSVNTDGNLTVKVIRTAEDSQHRQVVQINRSVTGSEAPIVRRLDRYSIFFIIGTYIIGGAAWAITGHPLRFLEVIIVAAPSSFLLPPAIALITNLNRAFREGIVVKSGRIFEQLANVKTVVFNKTSTLTTNPSEVDNVVAYKPFTEQEVLILIASVEQRSNRTFTQAILADVSAKKLRLLKARHVQETAGYGLEARINNKEVVIGRFDLLQKRNIEIPQQFKPKQVTQAVSYIAVDGKLAGYITFTDNIRSDIKPALITLEGLGVVRALLVTSDHQAAATQFAKRVGITDIKAEALPGDELHVMEAVEELPVAFIGNGITDSPALTAADVGIVIGARGQAAASNAADVVIMKDDLSHAAQAIVLAKWAFHITKQSAAIGVGVSTALMLIFATGLFSPIIGAFLREVIDIIVILNALRPRVAPYAS